MYLEEMQKNDLGTIMCGKGPHEPTIAYDIVRIHSLMIYNDIVEYNIVGDTKAPLLSTHIQAQFW